MQSDKHLARIDMSIIVFSYFLDDNYFTCISIVWGHL